MDRKWTHVMFAAGGLMIAWILSKTIDWVWGYFAKPQAMTVGALALVIAGVVTFVAWKSERLFTLASEVSGELRKVTWPTRQETINSTIVVIITTVIASGILGLFDGVWSAVTRKIYG